VLRSNGLLRVKASRASVFQSDLKTGGGVTVGGACGTIAEVASESS
jgi:riboflavin synthase alpha subunit